MQKQLDPEVYERCVAQIQNDKFINHIVNEQAKMIALAPLGKITITKDGAVIKYKCSIATICVYKQMQRLADMQRRRIMDHYKIDQ